MPLSLFTCSPIQVKYIRVIFISKPSADYLLLLLPYGQEWHHSKQLVLSQKRR